MNSYPPSLRLILTACAVAGIAKIAAAQAATPAQAKPGSAATPAEAAVVLSPFTVTTERDTGFVAASSLAGGRLASDLRDTAADYSVLTRDFIDALNLTDVADATRWTVNSYDLGDSGDGATFGGSLGNTNASQLRFRGLATNTPQLDFFPANYDYDSFSIERLDYARGASGVLFGTGSFSGTPNGVLKRARTDKTFGEVKVTGGSWDTYRATVDANYALTKTLGLRGNILFHDAHTWRQNEFSKRKAISLAGTYRPWEKATVNVSVETGDIKRNVGATLLRDFFSSWDGKTVFNGVQGARTGTLQGGQFPNGNGTTTGLNNLQAGVNRYGSDINPYWIIRASDPKQTLWNYANVGRTATLETENGALGNQIGGVVAPLAGAAITGLRGANLLNSLNVVDYKYDTAIKYSNYRTPSRAWTTIPRTPNTTQNYDTMTLTANQQVGKYLFLEAAGNFTRVTRKGDFTMQNTMPVYIDINKTLPDGRANPHFLDPYLEKESPISWNRNIARNGRAGAALVFENTRFGDYTVSLSAGQSLVSDHSRSSIMSVKDSNPGAGANPTGDPRMWPRNNIPRFWMYFNEDSYNTTAPGLTTLTDVRMVGTGAGAVPTYSSRQVNVGYSTTSASTRRFDNDYQLAALQAKLFNKRLSLLAAARRDGFSTISRSTWGATPSLFELPANWDGQTEVFRPKAPSDYFKLSYRTKDAAGNPTSSPQLAVTRPRNANGSPQAQYLTDRFQDDYSLPDQKVSGTVYSAGGVLHVTKWASLTGSYGESFDAPSLQPRITGENFDPILSKTKSYGVRFDLPGNRLSLTVSRYTGEQTNVAINSTLGIPVTLIPSSNMNFIINANKIGDLSPDGFNQRGLTPVVSNYSESGGRKSEGYEVELVANPFRGMRATFNYALPKAFLNAGYLDTKSYLARNLPTLKQIAEDAGAVIDASNRASIRPGLDLTQAVNVNDAVTGWNALQDLQRAFPDAQTAETRLNKYSFNVFLDYTLQEGRLKGLRFGMGGNWRGPTVVGNLGTATIKDPNSSNPAAVIDDPKVGPTDYVWAKGYYQLTSTLGYEFKLRGKIPVRIDFKVENLTDYDRPLYNASVTALRNKNPQDPGRWVLPDGAYYLRPRYWEISATTKF